MKDLEIVRAVAVLNRTFLSWFSAELAGVGLSYTEGVMVVNVGHHPGATQDALAAELALDKAAIARAVKTLVKRKLVQVSRRAEDRRAKRLSLTRAGEARCRDIEALNRTWLRAILPGIPAGERRVFYRVLATLAGRARALPAELSARSR